MNKLFELIKETGWYNIATVDKGGNPASRYFSSAVIVDGELCICTGEGKDVCNEILSNPHLLLSGFNGGMNWWRANVVAHEVTTPKHVEAMFEDMPELRDLYREAGRGGPFTMRVFALGEIEGQIFEGMKVDNIT